MPEWVVPGGGILAILAGLVVALTNGALYTRGQVNKMFEGKNEAVKIANANAERWQAIAMRALEVNDRYADAVRPVPEALRASQQVMNALAVLAEKPK